MQDAHGVRGSGGDIAVSHQVRDIFREASESLQTMADGPYADAVERAADVLERAFREGGKVLVFGNGGSSADAQHLTAELVGRFEGDRRPLAAIALTTNQAILTAWSNDHSFEDVFVRQLEALGRAGDVAVGITTSGRSPNVVNALRRAGELGLRRIAMTGSGGEDLAPLCDVLLAVPLAVTARVQEAHVVTYHAICASLERRLFSPRRAT